jgi:hypothetical protein
MSNKKYDFGEKTKENYKTRDGLQDLEVWQTPKYIISRTKAIELIESEKYGLDEGDFWILKNLGGKKLCYTGLIISHNGCLKINDKLEDTLKFKPSCVSFVKDAGNKEKVMSYINEEQGVYEFGEISPDNCKNDYPYAMVLKRLMDRVILKNSKVGFFGIYSEAESDDFKDKPDAPEKADTKKSLAKSCDEDMKETLRLGNEQLCERLTKAINAKGSTSELEGWLEDKAVKSSYAKLEKYASDLFAEVKKSELAKFADLDPDNLEP